MAARASDKTSNWRRTAIIYLLAAAVMVGLAFAAWPKPIAMIEAFTAGVAVGAALVIFSHLPMRQAYLDMSDAAETMSRARSQARAERQERDVVPFIPGEQTTTQPRTVKTCAFCEPMCATTERQLADRLKRMRQIPHVPVLPCSKCGSTDWATTDKFVVRRDEPQQSASEDARATPPAEPSS